MSESAAPVVDARAGSEGTRIDLDDVCRWFEVGGTVVKAVDRVNLHVDETAFVVVLGASGSGKTTLLNLVGALDAPTAGTIRLAGRDLSSASRAERTRIRRQTVSFIFQSFNLFPGLTALENVQFGDDVVLTLRPGASRPLLQAELGRALARAVPPVSATVTSQSQIDSRRILYEDIKGNTELWRVIALLVLGGTSARPARRCSAWPARPTCSPSSRALAMRPRTCSVRC